MLGVRASSAILVCVALIVGTAVACVAQQAQSESIYIANTKVITIRDSGAFPTVRDRAIAIDKAVTDIISTQDTQNLTLTMKEEGGLWSIYSGPIKIVSVSEAEAAANKLPPRSLAAVWVKNLRETFPKATPCSKLPASAFQPKPGVTPVAATSSAAPPEESKPEVPVAAITATTPVVAADPAPVATPRANVIGAPELLVRDVFNTVRALPEDEFTARRDELVQHLITDLTPFITGKVASALAPMPTAPVRTAPVPTAPVATTPVATAPVETTPTGPAVVPTTPATAPTAPVSTAPVATAPTTPPPAAAPAASNLPSAKDGDPSYAKVPQKNRIRKKLEESREPYLTLRREDADAAKPINDLLSACRSAYAKGDFDEAERYIDSALQLLGL